MGVNVEMGVNWNELEGRQLKTWRLESFLGERDERGFFVCRNPAEDEPFLMQLMVSGARADSLRASWVRAKQLSHEHLLAVHDCGTTDLGGTRFAYGIFDLPDDDLGESLTTRSLGEQDGRALISAIASALDYLHSQGLRHGSVFPPDVFLLKGDVRLGVDTITPAGAGGKAADMKQLGSTIVAAMTGRTDVTIATDARRSEAVAQLDQPFRHIAIGCLDGSPDRGWTARRVIEVLSGRAPAPRVEPPVPEPVKAVAATQTVRAPEPPPARPAIPVLDSAPPAHVRPTWPVVAAIAIPIVLIGIWAIGRTSHSEPQASAPVTAVVEQKPDPAKQSPVRAPAAAVKKAEPPVKSAEPPRQLPQPPTHVAEPAKAPAREKVAEAVPKAPDRRTRSTNQSGNWAVIAATYKYFGAAAKRVNALQRQSPELHPHVYPRDGAGARYYVVLASGLSQDAAAELLRNALQQGAPPDAYVTKLTEQ